MALDSILILCMSKLHIFDLLLSRESQAKANGSEPKNQLNIFHGPCAGIAVKSARVDPCVRYHLHVTTGPTSKIGHGGNVALFGGIHI